MPEEAGWEYRFAGEHETWEWADGHSDRKKCFHCGYVTAFPNNAPNTCTTKTERRRVGPWEPIEQEKN